MASAKDLRKRIQSVKNTQQITKAMKMVSAAKLRRAQDNIISLRPYAHEVNAVISGVAHAGRELTHPLLAPREQTEKPNILMVLVTSDRGLCGAFNGSIIKTGQRLLKTEAEKYGKVDFAFIGKKGYEFFKLRKPGKYYSSFFTGLTFAKSAGLSQELVGLYLSGEYDEIKFIYNEFKSAISQKVTVETLLPIRAQDGAQAAEAAITIYEPSAPEILDALLPKHFAVQVHRMLLESLAGEHGARMAAMENATKNAGEMIRKITLLYNKTRQAGITKELLEIISGTEAAKG
ncbi:MAG: ATP synthase F1 subunit gamma [Deltaproteobacteria bacterium]|nr:ATP synthase F1 subunit gamma [Deltaproteobacteria bacterium]